jgi:hypothetical protein
MILCCLVKAMHTSGSSDGYGGIMIGRGNLKELGK